MIWNWPRDFLFTEGLIQSREQTYFARSDHRRTRGPAAEMWWWRSLPTAVTVDSEQTQRNFFANSSCGVCGKASIDAVRSRLLRPPNAAFRVAAEMLCRMPEKLGSSQDIFGRTGGLHAAGLFTAEGDLLVSREDIGRHNAVDKVIGWALQENRLPLSDVVMLVSGRCGFEIAQKAIVAGIPVVGSVSAPSSLAAQLARELKFDAGWISAWTTIRHLFRRRTIAVLTVSRAVAIRSLAVALAYFVDVRSCLR